MSLLLTTMVTLSTITIFHKANVRAKTAKREANDNIKQQLLRSVVVDP